MVHTLKAAVFSLSFALALSPIGVLKLVLKPNRILSIAQFSCVCRADGLLRNLACAPAQNLCGA